MNHDPFVELRDVTKRYGAGAAAVDGIDLSIRAGEFITLLGPSGSGKTTTLNMLAGFIQATSGTIHLRGADLTTVPPNRRNFGMVFQNYALFPHLSVFENVAYPLRQRRVPRAKLTEQVQQIIESFDLGGMERRKPAQLSGGQQQRVALARAVVFAPELLLLDEPLGALDRKLRQSLQLQVKRLHRELGLTFVFVTHDQEEAMFLSDTIAVFNRGRIERVGSPAELYDDPGTLFVADFLGEANVFAGRQVDPQTYLWNEEKLRIAVVPSVADAALIVRPERVSVLDQDAVVPNGWNSIAATVTDVSHLGTACRVDLAFGAGTAGCASLPAAAAASVRPGDRVRAAWEPAAQAFVTSSGPSAP